MTGAGCNWRTEKAVGSPAPTSGGSSRGCPGKAVNSLGVNQFGNISRTISHHEVMAVMVSPRHSRTRPGRGTTNEGECGKLSCQLSSHESRPSWSDCWHGTAAMADGEAERAQEARERQRLELEDHISAAIRRTGAWVMGCPGSQVLLGS